MNSSGRGTPLAVFYKEEYETISDHNEKNIDITKIQSEDLDVIAIYRRKEGSLSSLIEKIHNINNWSKSTLIIGDMVIRRWRKINLESSWKKEHSNRLSTKLLT